MSILAFRIAPLGAPCIMVNSVNNVNCGVSHCSTGDPCIRVNLVNSGVPRCSTGHPSLIGNSVDYVNSDVHVAAPGCSCIMVTSGNLVKSSIMVALLGTSCKMGQVKAIFSIIMRQFFLHKLTPPYLNI